MTPMRVRRRNPHALCLGSSLSADGGLLPTGEPDPASTVLKVTGDVFSLPPFA